jgi:hypothetical protein
MTFNRDLLPDPATYYESQGLKLSKGKKWVTTECVFHGGSDSMRINLETGAFVCMAECGARGGDVLSYHRALHKGDFVPTCKELGCWVEDGKKPLKVPRPSPLPLRDALSVLEFETLLVAGTASSMGQGYNLNEGDRARLIEAANRIQKITGLYL